MRYLELYDPGLAMIRAGRRRANSVQSAVPSAMASVAPSRPHPAAVREGSVAPPTTALPAVWSDPSVARRAA